MSKLEDFKLPDHGFVFWPVGSGDSTTIAIDVEHHMQVDIRQMDGSTDENDPHAPVVDVLKHVLPKVGGKPYLATFVLTHPDQDHCQGFIELLESVKIGEIWFSPRVFREFDKDLCDDAQVFKDEAERRVKEAINGNTESGDRVRIIGYSELLEEDEFRGFPEDLLTIPGTVITEIDGDDLAGDFRAFVHAPFKDSPAAARNNSSIALHVTLGSGSTACRAMLLGDLANATLNLIFSRSEDEDLAWEVFLAPHHCSKSVMYVPDEDGNETLDQNLLDQIEAAANGCRYIVSSSDPVPSSNKPGDNPPHAIAKSRYEEIVEDGHFVCTQEFPSEDEPEPIVIALLESGCDLRGDSSTRVSRSTVTDAVSDARGTAAPPAQHVGFGNS